MALIDRDATLERMKSMAGCATCDNYNYVRCRACIWNDAMNIVEEMTAVDAIPVAWLKKLCDSYDYNLFYSIPLKQVLKSWEIEKHLQNERRAANETG